MERTFGVLKRRFRILRNAPEYTIDTQRNLVYALVVIHNFLVEEKVLLLGIEDFESDLEEIDANLDVSGVSGLGRSSGDKEEAQEMNVLRDQFADSMYKAYIDHILSR